LNTGIAPNPSTQNISVSNPGLYSVSVTITDGNGCKNTSDPVVGKIKKAPSVPVITALGGDASVCQGDSIVLRAAPFSSSNTYTWNPGAVVSGSITIKTPGANSYILTVDSNGCVSAAATAFNVNINPRPTPPTISISAGSASFCSGQTATLTSSASASYLWSPGALTSQSIVVGTQGNYSVVAIDDSSCSSLPSSPTFIEVRKNPEIPLLTSTSLKFCSGKSATISISNPGASNTYAWFPAGTGTSINVSAAGTYSVRSDSSNNCSSQSSQLAILVDTLPKPKITTSEPDFRVCIGESVTLTSNSSSGNVWLGAPGNPTTNSITINQSVASIVLKVTDSNSCTDSTGAVQVIIDPLPTVTLLKDTVLVVGEDFNLTASNFPTNSASFEWFKADVSIANSGNVPSQAIEGSTTSNYAVLLTDVNGCQVSDTILIRVSKDVYVPNSFSPNGDDKNDRLKVYGFGVKTIEFKVWDRMGNLVYESNSVDEIVSTSEDGDPKKGWDGKYKGKELSQESYIWNVKGTFYTGESIRVVGGNNSGSVIILN
jgi:gliding motility-associated-like protein